MERKQKALAAAVMAVLVLFLAFAGTHVGQSGNARAASARTPPNVVLILSDDQTYQSEKFMKHSTGSGWTSFRNAFVSTSLCCPSRATILTGQYAFHTGVLNNSLAHRLDASSTLATWLSPTYRTGLFGKYFNGYPFRRGTSYVPPGWDEWHAFYRVPGYYNYRLVNGSGHLVHYGHHSSDYSTNVLANKVVRFIKDSTGRNKEPFFAYYAPLGPHAHRVPGPGDYRITDAVRRYGSRLLPNFNERNVSDKPRWVRRLPRVYPRLMRRKRRRELKTLLSVDAATGRIVRTLRRSHELDNTVVIYLSDNGFSYGSHRYVEKNCAYDECIQVPLQMRLPGRNPRRITTPVSNTDLASTITDLAGVRPDIPQDGRSLLPIIHGKAPHQRRLLLEMTQHHPGWGVRSKRYEYDRLKNGDREFYDLRKDPFEMKNRIHNRHYRDVKHKLVRWLHRAKSS